MVKVPPINLVLTVEAVTRLGSFKLAAAELLITPSAVSHRIRQLEDRLGRDLFNRVGQGVQPTVQALRLAEVVGKARRDIADVWQEIHAEAQSGPVRVSCLAAFAGNYILPHMERFSRRFPQVELDLTSSLFSGSPRELHSDILISSGPLPGSDWWSEEIMPMDMLAIVTAAPHTHMVKAGELIGPLLSYTTAGLTWDGIAGLLGLELRTGARIITLDSVEAACTAAERGMGIALAPVTTARRLIHTGRVQSIGSPISTGLSYWMAVRRERRASTTFQAFRHWISDAVARDAELA